MRISTDARGYVNAREAAERMRAANGQRHMAFVNPCGSWRHGECPGVWARCSCGWTAEYGNEPTARAAAAAHGKEQR
jgi:hypothetical protein